MTIAEQTIFNEALEEGINIGREEGIQQGINIGTERGRQEGINIGTERGISIGKEEGLTEGALIERRKTALKLYSKGMTIEEITDLLDLTEDEVKALKETL